jgi:hypothetical protein
MHTCRIYASARTHSHGRSHPTHMHTHAHHTHTHIHTCAHTHTHYTAAIWLTVFSRTVPLKPHWFTDRSMLLMHEPPGSMMHFATASAPTHPTQHFLKPTYLPSCTTLSFSAQDTSLLGVKCDGGEVRERFKAKQSKAKELAAAAHEMVEFLERTAAMAAAPYPPFAGKNQRHVCYGWCASCSKRR